MSLRLLNHPLASHLLTELRDLNTAPDRFRHLCHQLTTLLVIEATTNIKTSECVVDTPLEKVKGQRIGEPVVVVPILRAGLGMLEPIASLFPDVSVGYIGLERDESTAVAFHYYCKLPELQGKFVICVDPMLATGGTASQALKMIRGHGGENAILISVVCTPQGVARIKQDHPDVDIVAVALDRGLNSKSYIVPGLGDFGDRLYGTF